MNWMLFYDGGLFFPKSFGRAVVENEKLMHYVTGTMENPKLERGSMWGDRGTETIQMI